MNRRQAIRNRCIDCSGHLLLEVRECKHKTCKLYPFRMKESNGKTAKQRDKAIKSYCRWCMGDSRHLVSHCPAKNCSLYKFRNTNSNKKEGVL